MQSNEYSKEEKKELVKEMIRYHVSRPKFDKYDCMLDVFVEYGVEILEEVADEAIEEMCKDGECIIHEDGTFEYANNLWGLNSFASKNDAPVA